MQQRGSRAGFTLVGLMLVLLTVAVVVLSYFTYTLNVKVKAVDENGRELTEWIGKTDDPAISNAPGGLTTYVINLKKHVLEHMGKKVTGPGAAHTGASDMHLDPPPPPPW